MPEIPFGKNIKRVGGAHKIVELRVDKRRVYGFVDATTGETMICACSQSVNRGDKSAMQEAAIREAEELRGRWLSAKHLPGFEDVRVE